MAAARPGLAQRLRASLARLIAPQETARPLRGLHGVRRFDAARIDRLTGNWMATSASINEELRTDLDKLRMRGRDLVKNNDYARKFVGMCQTNIVGPDGFKLQARVENRPGIPDGLANAAIEAAFAEWSRAADITGTMSLRDVCDTLVGGLPSDGEFLARFIRGPEAGNRFNFAVQLIDVDRIDTTYNTTATGTGNRITMGVERDAFGRPLALWLFDGHPNDGPHSSRTRTRVSTDEVLHRYKVSTPGQARGVPWMAPGMLSLHHLGGFKLAALLAAEHGANHFGFFTTPDGVSPVGATDEEGQPITTSQPGTFDTLPPGVQFTPFESKYPSDNFGPFVKTTLQRIASGWGVAYHSLANDLEGVSFSSIRSGTLEERDRWAADQAWFVNAFLDPLYAEWLQQALLSGAIVLPNGSALPASKMDKFGAHEWQGRRWEWVDPKSDMEAKILSVRAGLIAPQDLAAQMGYDFDATLGKIAQAQRLAEEYGVTLHAYEGTPGATPAASEADPAQRELDPAPDPVVLALDTVTRSLAALSERAPAPAAAPVAVHLGIDREQASAMAQEIQQLHRASLEQIREDIQAMPVVIPAPVVNVAAPIVNVAAPEVTVEATLPPAEVVVNHPTLAVQTVERNAEGDILQTTTRYA